MCVNACMHVCMHKHVCSVRRSTQSTKRVNNWRYTKSMYGRVHIFLHMYMYAMSIFMQMLSMFCKEHADLTMYKLVYKNASMQIHVLYHSA